MANELLTWDEKALLSLNAKLNQSHAAYQTILLTNYYYASASQLGIKNDNAQRQLYLATLSLDRALANALRQRKGVDRLMFYRATVQPLDAAFTKLMDQLKAKGLLKQPRQLQQEEIDRQLARIENFKHTVQRLPGLQQNLLFNVLTFIQQLIAWVQGKPLPRAQLPNAINNFVTANRLVLGGRHGG